MAVFFACNSSTQAPAVNDESTTKDTIAVNETNNKTTSLYNNLAVLFIESSEFVRIVGDISKKNKITFRFSITDPDSLTMHGWKNFKGESKFNPDPDMILHNGINSTFMRNQTYLGNSVLYDTTIELIIKKLGIKNRKFIVFFPQDPASNNGLLIYKIRLTDDDPKNSSFANLANSGEDAEELNPSPPRNAN